MVYIFMNIRKKQCFSMQRQLFTVDKLLIGLIIT